MLANLMLYIVRFLHQTTTRYYSTDIMDSCISSVSYIKPQLPKCCWIICPSCISSVSYIKPQLTLYDACQFNVVYRPFPTSNHNVSEHFDFFFVVVYRPFPTSNHNLSKYLYYDKKVVYRPFPTSNHNHHTTYRCNQHVVYRPFPTSNHNCLPLYVKSSLVVYRPFPTSNHNEVQGNYDYYVLYIVRFLHQTTTYWM